MLRPVHPKRACLALLATVVAILGAAAPANAITPTIVNNTAVGTQPGWLEGGATIGESGNGRNKIRISVVINHDANRSVAGLRLDDDYDGTDNSATKTLRGVSVQRQSVNGGTTYTRITYVGDVSTSNNGFDCPFIGTADRSRNKTIRLRAELDDGTQTATSNGNLVLVADTQCTGHEDYPFIKDVSQNATTIDPGTQVRFTYGGDDIDGVGLGGHSDFNGIKYRVRRVSDNVIDQSGKSCPNNGDNQSNTLDLTFNKRGRYVVEAIPLNECGGSDETTDNGIASYFYLGAVDVNSQSGSPTASITGVPARPTIGQTISATASLADPGDSSDGGVVQNLEWDLDFNSTNGLDGYEAVNLGDPSTGLTNAQKQRSINTTGMTPGNKTIRIRATDNGAMNAADTSRKQATATATFKVDTPPVVNNQTVTTDAEDAVPVDFSATDVDGDSLAYTINDAPDHGTLTGSGDHRTYTPDANYAGNDSVTVQVSDAYGGSDTATLALKVRPQTTITGGPSGPTNNTTADFDFTSQTGATFECNFDGVGYAPCDSSTATYSALADDTYTFDVRATSSDGLVEATAAHREFTVDTVLPDTDITDGPAEGSFSPTATPTFDFSANEAGSTFECSVDGDAFQTCGDPETLATLNDGEHTLEVRAVDPAGNKDSDPASRTWTSDTVAPDTEITVKPALATNSNAAGFEFDSTDDTATFQCSLDGSSFLSCDNPKTYRDLVDGSHTVQVRAIDPATNVDASPESYTFSVDTLAPDTNIDTKPDAATQDVTGDFTFSSTEGGNDFACTVDGEDPVDCDGGSFTTDDLEDGQHVFTVSATDAVGNADASAASYTWTVDNGKPNTSIGGGPTGSVNVDDAEFNLSSNELGVTYECKSEADSDFGSCTSPVNRTDLPEGDYSLEVKATDAAGNEDPTPAKRVWDVDLTAPTTAIVGEPDALSNTRDAAFEFEGNDPNADGDDAPLTFECALDPADADNPVFEPCADQDVFPDLADGDHKLIVRAKDAAGNVDDTDVDDRTVDWTIDATVPVSTINSGPVTGDLSRTNSQDAEFTFGSDGGDDDDRECKLDNGAWEACTTSKSYTNLGEGQHTFRVRATDEALNVESTPASRSWTVDLTAPDSAIDAGPDASTNLQTARFEFSADEAGATFECNLDAAGWEACDSGKEYSDLAVGAHTFQVRATDDVTNLETTPASRTWTIDRKAPDTAITAGPNGTVRSDSATFEFSADDDHPGSTFQCRLDGGVWVTCTSARDVTGLSNGKHKFEVRATDAAGNVDASPADREWTVSRSDAPDTTIVSGPSGTVPATDASFAFTSSDSEATFECSLDGAAFAACASPQAYSGLSASAHTFDVRAKDPQGNVDASPANRAWTITIPGANTPSQVDGGEEPPATCKTFKEPAPCQPASLATLVSAKKAKTKTDLTLTAKSGGPELDAVTFTIPKGVTVKAVKKALGKGAGTLTLKNAKGGKVSSASLKLPKKVKTSAVLYEKNGVRVNLRLGSKPSVTVSGLPAGVTEVVLLLKGKSSGLIVTPKKCAAGSWTARMGDRSGGSATATKSAQLCGGTGGKR